MATIPLATIFGVLGNTISFMVFLSPIPTFYRIYKKKSTEGYQSLPYVVALFSSVLWILYALITPKSTFLKTINSFGIFIETVYITIFLVYATKKAKITTVKLLLLMNVAGLGVIVFVTFVIAKTSRVRAKILGWICLIFSICVFVAPLGVMRQVIRTKSVEYMPFLLSLFLTISAVMWFFYGLFRKDMFVAIPNVLGFSFGIVQMVLYAMYRKSNKAVQILIVPLELATTKDQQIIEVVKLASQETLSHVEAPELTVVANSRSNRYNVNEEQVYSVEIRNCSQEMIEEIKNIGGIEAPDPPNVVTIIA